MSGLRLQALHRRHGQQLRQQHGQNLRRRDAEPRFASTSPTSRSFYIAIWSSVTSKMSALVLPQDPAAHRELLSDIISESTTYITNIKKRRIQVRSHLTEALHAIPSGVAHHSHNTIRPTDRQQDYQPPKPEHQDLMDYLQYYIDSLQAFHDQHQIPQGPGEIANYLTSLSRDYLSRPLPTSQGEVVAQQTLRESSTSSSSSISIADRPPQLMIGTLHNITEEETARLTSRLPLARPSRSIEEDLNHLREDLLRLQNDQPGSYQHQLLEQEYSQNWYRRQQLDSEEEGIHAVHLEDQRSHQTGEQHRLQSRKWEHQREERIHQVQQRAYQLHQQLGDNVILHTPNGEEEHQ